MLLWERIEMVVGQREEVNTCIIRDFNSILEVGEMMGVGGSSSGKELREYKNVVNKSKFVDVRLVGRKFIYYKSGGLCKSRFDKALVNETWAGRRQGSELRRLPRTISDHYGIIFSTKMDVVAETLSFH